MSDSKSFYFGELDKPVERQPHAHIGEKEVFIAHIAKEDAPAVYLHVIEFNALVRRCGGMPLTRLKDPTFEASVAFMTEQFRQDFVDEMKRLTGVDVIVDKQRAWVDRKELPPWLQN
ncbi:MAG: hypothetical protein LIP10_03640 [Clostridiales bacterium]|nr:hypothetical protein [Clostridiales bacterium]